MIPHFHNLRSMNKFQSRIAQYADPLQFHFHPFLVTDQQQLEFIPVTLQRHADTVDDRAGRIVAAHHIHGYVDHFAGLTFWHSRYSLADDADPFFPQNNWKISSQSPCRRHSCGMDYPFRQTKGLANFHPPARDVFYFSSCLTVKTALPPYMPHFLQTRCGRQAAPQFGHNVTCTPL